MVKMLSFSGHSLFFLVSIEFQQTFIGISKKQSPNFDV